MKFKHFTYEEFTRTSTGIKNILPEDLIINADNTLLCLDKIREAFGKPITISSGYRCLELNGKVSGENSSLHLTAEAADLQTKDVDDMAKLWLICKNQDFDLLIWENGGQWIHISFKSNGKNRHQVIV